MDVVSLDLLVEGHLEGPHDQIPGQDQNVGLDKAEDEEVPIAEQLREPKLAEQMLELQARSLLLRHHRRRS